MNAQIKGVSGSFFHNSLLVMRDEDRDSGRSLIGLSDAGDDVICRLNGYAIIPIEEYHELKGENTPMGTDLKIEEMNRKLTER